MKLIKATLAVACLLLDNSLYRAVHASTAVRGGSNEKEGEPAARVLEEETTTTPTPVEDVTANDGTKKVVPDHYPHYPKYETGSCTCAHEANMAVRRAVADEFKNLPLVPGIFDTLQIYLNRFLDYAVCAFHAIDCGCDDGRYGYKIINYYKVSTFQCCCDVHAMKDVIIKAVKKIASSWKMRMVGDGASMRLMADPQSVQKPFLFDVFEREFRVAVASVEKIGEIYGIPDECDDFNTPCKNDGECRLFSDYCEGCNCRALGVNETDPTCDGTTFNCFADPCHQPNVEGVKCENGICKVIFI